MRHVSVSCEAACPVAPCSSNGWLAITPRVQYTGIAPFRQMPWLARQMSWLACCLLTCLQRVCVLTKQALDVRLDAENWVSSSFVDGKVTASYMLLHAAMQAVGIMLLQLLQEQLAVGSMVVVGMLGACIQDGVECDLS